MLSKISFQDATQLFALVNFCPRILYFFNNCCQLEEEIAARNPFFSGLLLSVFNACLGHLSNPNSAEIHTCLYESSKLGQKLLLARRTGRKFAKEAVWIPVTRCVLLATPASLSLLIDNIQSYSGSCSPSAHGGDKGIVQNRCEKLCYRR